MSTRISAVIPTYNRGQLVGRAIESALNQEFPPAEIVVVDDGSTDNTQSVVEAFREQAIPLRYVYQENKGVAAARNRGVAESQSEWIAFLDSDDAWVKEHLANMARAIEQTQGVGALYFADLIEPGGRRYWSKCGFTIESGWEMRRDAAEWCLMPIQPMMLQASVLSRRVFETLGRFPEQMRTREDTLLFFKLGFQYPVCAVQGCGTIMHADDAIRLTKMHDGRTAVFNEASIFMYRNLLETPTLSARHRRALTSYLSSSHYQMGKVSIKQGRYSVGLKHLVLSYVTSPKNPMRVVFGH